MEPTFTLIPGGKFGRRGVLRTVHGEVETPAFLFCATKGSVKGLSVLDLCAQGTGIVLANTYHLMLQPGSALIQEMGGLHSFMGWSKPLFTDSGGYQIFSLHYGSVSEEIKGNRKGSNKEKGWSPVVIREEGALFTAHRDGKRHLLTPEKSIQVQCELGADFVCVLDICTPLHLTKEVTRAFMDQSHRWATRSLTAFAQVRKAHQGLYGIIQGGVHADLRKESAEFVSSLPLFGVAVGGSLGDSKAKMDEVVDMALSSLPHKDRPIHLLGIGRIRDIFSGVSQGIDTFDCVAPTRLGRHGCALIQPHYWRDAQELLHGRESINLWKACFRTDPKPLDEKCPCTTCRTYSRAYLHHLLKTREILALTALTLHNVCFMNRLMAAIRIGIATDTLSHVQSLWCVDA